MLIKEKNVEKEKECWVRSRSDLSQILTKLLTDFNYYTENLLAFIANWLKF